MEEFSKESLKNCVEIESKKFEKFFLWIQENMPKKFFREVDRNSLTLITHNLMNLEIQGYFSVIVNKNIGIVLCPDTKKTDERILEHFSDHGIRYYRTYTSLKSTPIPEMNEKLVIAFVHLTEGTAGAETKLPKEVFEELEGLIKEKNPDISSEQFHSIVKAMHSRFLFSMSKERIVSAIDMFFKALNSVACQFEVQKVLDYKETGSPSLKLMIAWKNVPKRGFLLNVLQTVNKHNLKMTRFTATYVNPFSTENILIMSLGIDGLNGEAAWESADIEDLERELAMLKLSGEEDLFEKTFVQTNRLSEHQCHFLRSCKNFVHQVLVHKDANQYTLEQIEKDLCRHTNFTLMIQKAFEAKFKPDGVDLDEYKQTVEKFKQNLTKLDTGHAFNDERRKNVLKTAMVFVEFILKTSFYEIDKLAIGFRLDPNYLDYIPYDRKEIFEEIPFGIFFIMGMNFIGFHIRFKDLSRGGLRTIISKELEQLTIDKNQIFTECYNLAYTQQKKNKDIPEGGAKGVILLDPFQIVKGDSFLLEQELLAAKTDKKLVEEKIAAYKNKMKQEFLYLSQKSYIDCLLSLINCEKDGSLKAKSIVDYWKRPEYIYLGPDENMHNSMIEWIADYSVKNGYEPGRSFISSKPSAGINHKEYGVTSYGVNVYMHEALLFLGINPEKDQFTIKISGGPDGDVAGNQILNLQRFYKDTAKLLALTDVSGTIFDPEGLDLDTMVTLFKEAKSIRHYPPELLNGGGFLLDLQTKKEEKNYTQLTLCSHKEKGKVVQRYLSGHEMNHLFRTNVHQAKADIFIPAGGRPRTLNINNYEEFLDKQGKPTSKAIVEGANLYLSPRARRKLEEAGCLILKDSSCNKGGVMTSSMEVLSSLVLSEKEFLDNKDTLVTQILEFIKTSAQNEARLLLSTFKKENLYLTEVSDRISLKINKYKYQLLDFLETIELSSNKDDPLIEALLNYCPKLLKENFTPQILEKVPDIHKKAIISAYIASHLIYKKGILWSPTIVDVLPVLIENNSLNSNN